MKNVVLFGVLNWGLGHATRSIPIIQSLQRLNYQVIICSDGDALVLLQKEFPQASFVTLPAYHIRYAHSSMPLNIARYGLGLLKTIYQEEQQLKELVKQYSPLYIISDNRYGFHHAKVKSIIITHQLYIPTPNQWQGQAASHFLHRYIENFDVCWIPDAAEAYNLSGDLAHDVELAIPMRYIGFLSRLEQQDLPQKYDIAFILSGPEPQRSQLEKMILEQVDKMDVSCILIRGTVTTTHNISISKSTLEIIDLADSETLSNIISQSCMVLSRAGYTTIMDLVALRKCAILIPTPGQPEQEYLAEHLSDLFTGFTFFNQYDLDMTTLDFKSSKWEDRGELSAWSDATLVSLLEELG